MAAEDFIEAEVGVAVAATAVVLSPTVRSWLRKGAVYGLAGVMMAGDAVAAAARGASRGAGELASAVNEGMAAHDAGEAAEPAEGKAE